MLCLLEFIPVCSSVEGRESETRAELGDLGVVSAFTFVYMACFVFFYFRLFVVLWIFVCGH